LANIASKAESRERPSRLATSFREKVWGSTHLEPWFLDSDRKIGEVWYEGAEPLPVLVKLLFTSERLSVQVHPADEYARAHESSPGKTEMWHVLRADPGAPGVAAGLRETVSAPRLRELALSGEIEDYLNWIEVRPGDTIFIPAGTIHAIGPGLALCEIQQQSDITYRLYDYGRPRELHLDRAMDVSVAGPYRPPTEVPPGYLAYCPYFAVEEVRVAGAQRIEPKQERFELLIALEGSGTLAGEAFRAGEVWHVPAGAEQFTIAGAARLLRVHVP
jgi:mannose-6-phosphate isomerase